jgi:chorismate-pyruvate lyase
MSPADTPNMTRIILKKTDFGSLMLEKIAELEGRSGISLGLAQKVLLAQTGTVEQVLSILTGSTVAVKVGVQKETSKTITRQSRIVNDAGKVLIRAHSRIIVRNLPAKVVSQIRRQELGIGTIFESTGLETFRKIVQIGYNPISKSVFRKYQIICRQKVAFVIIEELVGIESGPGGI